MLENTIDNLYVLSSNSKIVNNFIKVVDIDCKIVFSCWHPSLEVVRRICWQNDVSKAAPKQSDCFNPLDKVHLASTSGFEFSDLAQHARFRFCNFGEIESLKKLAERELHFVS